MKVLVAEDDAITRKVLKETIKSLGYDVILAQNGVEALEILQEKVHPQIALVDWVMPSMDGIELCQTVRENSSTLSRYIYIIMLTGKKDTNDIVTGIQAGADDYIIKPFNKDELRVRIRAGARVIELQNQLLAANHQLKRLADHDHLTGIMNRRCILEQLEREMSRASRLKTDIAVGMLDIDFFKQVNDIYGHEVGDMVLIEVVNRIQSSLRQFDYIGRYGGEEFLLIVTGKVTDDFMQPFERVRESVSSQPLTVLGHEINLTVSIGFTVTGGEDNVVDLLRHSDNALYQAKETGRNKTCFNRISSKD